MSYLNLSSWAKNMSGRPACMHDDDMQDMLHETWQHATGKTSERRFRSSPKHLIFFLLEVVGIFQVSSIYLPSLSWTNSIYPFHSLKLSQTLLALCEQKSLATPSIYSALKAKGYSLLIIAYLGKINICLHTICLPFSIDLTLFYWLQG